LTIEHISCIFINRDKIKQGDEKWDLIII